MRAARLTKKNTRIASGFYLSPNAVQRSDHGFFISLIPATVWVILGYFVLFSSSKIDGGIRTFSQVLAIWIFVIAAAIVIAGAYVTAAGLCPIRDMLRAMHSVRP